MVKMMKKNLKEKNKISILEYHLITIALVNGKSG
jgi:hypothetical protein